MSSTLLPTTNEICEVFSEEISAAGGTVSDCFDDGRRLFLRSILPKSLEVRPGDRVQGGVALRTADEEILVHPYVFRQVCRNGAITCQSVESRSIPRVEFVAPPESVGGVIAELRNAIRVCVQDEVLAENADQMRAAARTRADIALTLMPLLRRMPTEFATQILAEVFDRYQAGNDRSLFGIMNAVTATARDTRDPETRWRLEELGGGIAACVELAPKPDGAAAELFVG
jgi:hypothetical protein